MCVPSRKGNGVSVRLQSGSWHTVLIANTQAAVQTQVSIHAVLKLFQRFLAFNRVLAGLVLIIKINSHLSGWSKRNYFKMKEYFLHSTKYEMPKKSQQGLPPSLAQYPPPPRPPSALTVSMGPPPPLPH